MPEPAVTNRVIDVMRANMLRTCNNTINVKQYSSTSNEQPHPDYEAQAKPTYTVKTLQCRVTDIRSGGMPRASQRVVYDVSMPAGFLDDIGFVVQYPSNSALRLTEKDKVEIQGSYYSVSAVILDSCGVQETAFIHK